jgi:hypothetical protein
LLSDRFTKIFLTFSDTAVEHWFLSYVELLQRFQLFTKANEVGVAFFDLPDTLFVRV